MENSVGFQRIDVREVGGVTVVRFRNVRLFNEENSIFELGRELFRLVEVDKTKKLLLNFDGVELVSSGVLGKLISLYKKMEKFDGVLKMSNICPNVYKVFSTTKLDKMFDIKDDQADALAAF